MADKQIPPQPRVRAYSSSVPGKSSGASVGYYITQVYQTSVSGWVPSKKAKGKRRVKK